MLGLYLHIPFCSAICNYCNFNRGLFDGDLKGRYVDALKLEIARAPAAPADTIFFGGGTPSLLDPSEIGDLIQTCLGRFQLDPDAEITLETNPETVNAAKLAAIRGAGVNRISFGVQSFHDEELRRLGRIHSADRAREAVRESRAAGFDNISLDLMMWLPGQTIERWLANVDALIDAGPDHASLYLLELYPNAPLREEMARGGWSVAPDDDAAEMYVQGLERLDAAGYEQYEISNVARPGRASRHNLKYWEDGDWLGFGCGAHSTAGGARWKNVASTADYIQRVAASADTVVERRALSPADRLQEAMFMGLRLTAGVDLDVMGSRYATDVWKEYGARLEPFVRDGWLVREGARVKLTRPGMLVANEIMAVFV